MFSNYLKFIPNRMSSSLELQCIRAGYGEHIVIDDLSARLHIGAIHGIVGKNGQGKTTLLNVLRGALAPLHGAYLLDGEAIQTSSVAMLDIESFFYPRITGSEYLRLFQFANAKFDGEKWNEIFELPLENEIETYSAGMRKKLAFMGIVGLNRPLLLLDEPFNSLDLDTNYVLVDILKLLASNGTTVILTSHILEPLLAVCDSILWLAGTEGTRLFAQKQFGEIEGLMRSGEYERKLAIVQELLG
jgi:ABC-2 type transport system ATP-binding protein